MDLTKQPNLKPLRSVNEHDVVNFFAYTGANLNKGTLVSISAADGNTNVWENAANPATPHVAPGTNSLTNTPTRATSLRWEVNWKVKEAETGDSNVLGMTLLDVKETNDYGEKTIWRPNYEKYENDYVTSGDAVPVATKGLFKVNGFTGTPGPGSGAIVDTATAGWIEVVDGDATKVTDAKYVGKFLTSADADGYAVLKLEL